MFKDFYWWWKVRLAFLQLYWGGGVVKMTKGEKKWNKRVKEEGWGCDSMLSRVFVICDGRNIPSKERFPVPQRRILTHLCALFQMGGGAVQARAAGIHDQIPAAGWETTRTHFLIISPYTDVGRCVWGHSCVFSKNYRTGIVFMGIGNSQEWEIQITTLQTHQEA